ncbi:MAG: CRISPR-associated helicase Cas3' [Brevinematales bacterium]|nr:CRISPR-associated helicase Cas3' [Brevinematales bacterium]
MSINSIKYFWSKTTKEDIPGIDVFHHSLIVGLTAGAISKHFPFLTGNHHLKKEMLSLLASLHDAGKISSGFQSKCLAWLNKNDLTKRAFDEFWDRDEKDHSKISNYALQRILIHAYKERNIKRRDAVMLACALASHHGNWLDCPEEGVGPAFGMKDDEWQNERLSLFIKLWKEFGKPVYTLEFEDKDYEKGRIPSILLWLAGLTTVADWIGSNEYYFPQDRNCNKNEVNGLIERVLSDIDFSLNNVQSGLVFSALFPKIKSPNSLQRASSESIAEPGLYIIEAPMGMGKTEAALDAAYRLISSGKARGLYFALPTQLTSNRIYSRIGEFIENIAGKSKKIRLIHGQSWLMTDLTEPENSTTESIDWFAGSKRSLIAPVGVGTVDQALMAVLAVKHFFVRDFALAEKVVIIDEVHSYDLYTGTLIDELCKVLLELNCTVIILSATLTGARRNELLGFTEMNKQIDSYPLITGTVNGFNIDPVTILPPQDKDVAIRFIDRVEALDNAVRLAKNGVNILWICDTVDSAIESYREISNKLKSGIKKGLLHSRFPFYRREEIENDWMVYLGKDGKERQGSMLVSTQIVEQSVDIDADLLITELAPTDMLLQRIGRLWRHERGYRNISGPEVWIIEESSGFDEMRLLTGKEIRNALSKKSYVYDPYVLLRTWEVWKDMTFVIIPGGIREAIENTYQDKDEEPSGWTELKKEMIEKKKTFKDKALMSMNPFGIKPHDDNELNAKTRIFGVPEIQLVLAVSIAGEDVELMDGSVVSLKAKGIGKLKAVYRNMVKLPCYYFEDNTNCLHFVNIPDTHRIGLLKVDGFIETEGLKKGTQLTFNDEIGVRIVKE